VVDTYTDFLLHRLDLVVSPTASVGISHSFLFQLQLRLYQCTQISPMLKWVSN
jgi:hypothetical protein